MSSVHKKGGVTNTITGSKFVPVKEISITEWLEPLVEGFLDYRTKEWRKKNINKNAQVIVVTDAALNAKDKNGDSVLLSGKTPGDVRNEAKLWINRRRPGNQYAIDIQSLNQTNGAKTTFHYVVVTNWRQSESFFKAMKKAGLMRAGSETHRGHDTAAVRLHGEAAMKKMKDTSESKSFGAKSTEKNIAYKASRQLMKDLQDQSNQLTPTIKFNSRVHIDRETKGIKGVDHLVILVPETKASNLGDKQKLEAAHRKKMQAIVDKFLKTYGDMRINVTGSKSPIQAVSDTVSDMLMDKKNKAYKTRTKKVIRVRKQKIAAPAMKVATPPPPRTSGGKFTSAMNIQAILNARIKEQVQDNMGKGGALVNRTGRFAESVSVAKVMQSRQGTLTAFYTYMKAPYQTFERGFAQGSMRRDPRNLIASSIREIARETLSHKIPIRTRRV